MARPDYHEAATPNDSGRPGWRWAGLVVLTLMFAFQLWLIPHLNARVEPHQTAAADPWLDPTVGAPLAAIVSPPQTSEAPAPTGSVAGQVMNAQGRPVAHAHMLLHVEEGGNRAAHEFETDIEGRFSVEALPLGHYRLQLSGMHREPERLVILSADQPRAELHIVLP